MIICIKFILSKKICFLFLRFFYNKTILFLYFCFLLRENLIVFRDIPKLQLQSFNFFTKLINLLLFTLQISFILTSNPLFLLRENVLLQDRQNLIPLLVLSLRSVITLALAVSLFRKKLSLDLS
jgi:hypothetical protein